jgi:hypothetical protein
MLYGVAWIALEGNLARVLILAGLIALTAASIVAERWLGGRSLSTVAWVVFGTFAGQWLGFGTAILALLLMVIKTGLHGHGPEFSVTQINWIIGQIPWWTSAGTVAGLGLALIGLAFRADEPKPAD